MIACAKSCVIDLALLKLANYGWLKSSLADGKSV